MHIERRLPATPPPMPALHTETGTPERALPHGERRRRQRRRNRGGGRRANDAPAEAGSVRRDQPQPSTTTGPTVAQIVASQYLLMRPRKR